MRGWKTYLSGGMSIMWGVGTAFLSGGASMNESMAWILGGLGVIGIGHKVEKAGNAVATLPTPR